jgi:hypothetical protein
MHQSNAEDDEGWIMFPSAAMEAVAAQCWGKINTITKSTIKPDHSAGLFTCLYQA